MSDNPNGLECPWCGCPFAEVLLATCQCPNPQCFAEEKILLEYMIRAAVLKNDVSEIRGLMIWLARDFDRSRSR